MVSDCLYIEGMGCVLNGLRGKNYFCDIISQSSRHFFLWFLLDEQSEGPNLISWLVMSNTSTYMIKSQLYSSNCFCDEQTPNIFYLKGAGSQWLRVNSIKRNNFFSSI